MIWILAAILLLLAGLWLKLSLLVFAMYVLLGTLMLSRFFTRAWVEKILATPVLRRGGAGDRRDRGDDGENPKPGAAGDSLAVDGGLTAA